MISDAKYIITVITSCFILISCGTAERGIHTPSTSEGSKIVSQLKSAHYEWQGTPYVLGGAGMGGVDCSAFIQIIFDNYFGVELPRHTREQLNEGNSVRRNFIRPGDLIFFRTGRGILHVGIAMNDGDFLHASVSQGVTISNIGENYWASRYLGTRRVL